MRAFLLNLLFACLWLVMGGQALPAREGLYRRAMAPAKVEYRRYVNEKYGYTVEYPAFLDPGGEPDAHDGQRFASPAKRLEMSVWGIYSNWQNGEEMTLAQEESWTRQNLAGPGLPSAKVTYSARGKDWFVLSGVAGANVFYRRTVKGRDTFATVQLVYPQTLKSEFAAVVSDVARSLKPSRQR